MLFYWKQLEELLYTFINLFEFSQSSSVSRTKSVWKPAKQANTSNWWDLSDGAQENADGDTNSTTISNRTSGMSNIGSVISATHNHRMSTSSSGSRGSYKGKLVFHKHGRISCHTVPISLKPIYISALQTFQ